MVPEATAAGVPYLKGGICETGGSLLLLQEAQLYAALPNSWGRAQKNMMRRSPYRAHFAGLSMVGENMPQEANRVDLDPVIRDIYGFPVPRITSSPHKHELAASAYYGGKLAAICQAAPGAVSGSTAGRHARRAGSSTASLAAGLAATAHIMGTARMGNGPRRWVVNAFGRAHEADNLYVGDGSVFVSAGGFNPTLTIMELARGISPVTSESPGTGRGNPLAAPTLEASAESPEVHGHDGGLRSVGIRAMRQRAQFAATGCYPYFAGEVRRSRWTRERD